MSKILIDEATAEQVLEALELVIADVKTTPSAYEAQRQAITDLREALAEQPAQQEPVAKKKHEPKIDLGKYAGTYGGYTTPEPSEGYLQKAYRLANELRSHLSIAPPQQEPVAHCEAGAEYCPVCYEELKEKNT